MIFFYSNNYVFCCGCVICVMLYLFDNYDIMFDELILSKIDKYF